MYDIASNKFYYEVSGEDSPETIEKTRAVLDEIGKKNYSDDDAVEMIKNVRLSVLNDCFSVSENTDISLVTNAMNGINDIIKILGIASEIISGGMSLYDEIQEEEGESKLVGFTDDEYEVEIFNIVDGARDKLFAVRQTVIELCAE